MTDKALEALIKQYRQTFPQKINDIEQALKQSSEAGWTTQSIQPLAALIHRLAGSAGAYGFNEIYRLAAAADSQLKKLATASTTAESHAVEDLRTTIAELLRALRHG